MNEKKMPGKWYQNCDVCAHRNTHYSEFPCNECTGDLMIPAQRIKDSGERREFKTGAVRDIQEGKGRCDLLPLDVIADLLEGDARDNLVVKKIHEFMTDCDTLSLHLALAAFCLEREWDAPTMCLEVAKHFEDGAKKYGEQNWQKGIPMHCYIDSALRHYFKWVRGDKDEPHDRAFAWNVLCCIWTHKHKPDMIDTRKGQEGWHWAD